MYSFIGVCILFPQPLLSELGMMSPVWSVGSSTSQSTKKTLHFTTRVIKKSFFFSVHWKQDPFMWVCVTVCHTLRLVLDRGWLRLLNLHGSEGVSTGSLWRSGVIPSVPGRWKMPMEMGRSFLDTGTNGKNDDSKRKRAILIQGINKCLRDLPVDQVLRN